MVAGTTLAPRAAAAAQVNTALTGATYDIDGGQQLVGS